MEEPPALFTGDGACDQDNVYRGGIGHDPDAVVIGPPGAMTVRSETAETKPIQRGRLSTDP